jgi:phage terminase large subunit-like protein
MGMRGPGAQRLRVAREAAPKRKRAPAWKRKGLSRAEQARIFLESLPVTKGRLRGRRMKLLPSQREFIEQTFATDRRGRFTVSLAIFSEPKGNGKSGLIAGVCLAALLGPLAEERGAVYAASIDRGKAGILYEEVKAIILAVPEFAARCNIVDFHKRIVVLDGDGRDSVFEALSADHRRSQGLGPVLWAYDEAGESPDDSLAKVLLESDGKRDHTFGIILSTQAEDDQHWLSRLIDNALALDVPGTYLQLHAAPPDADIWDEATIAAANPALGVFLGRDAVLKARDRARMMPTFEASYRRLRLNQRADSRPENRLIQAPLWKGLIAKVDRAKLKGRSCFGGLDLSGKHDLTALVLAFPDDAGAFDLLPFLWTPEGQLGSRAAAEAKLFREWIAAGHMTATPGNTVRYDWVAAQMAALAVEFEIRSIGFDRYRIDDLAPELEEAGAEIPLEAFGQGFVSMGPAVDVFAELAMSGRIRHDGHPVLTAAVANAITTSDPAGNLKVDKAKSNGRGPVRVDGAVAMLMALGVAKRFVPAPKPDLSAFLQRPVMVIR